MPRHRCDDNQDPFRPDGNKEYIRTTDGVARLTRIYLVADRRWRYTQLGLRFYAKMQTQYIVEVPVLIKGATRDRRSSYSKEALLPMELLGMGSISMPAIMSSEEAQNAIKRQVLSELERYRDREGFMVYEFSGETYEYDPSREWKISALQTNPQEGDPPEVSAVMNRPLGIFQHSDVTHPEDFI